MAKLYLDAGHGGSDSGASGHGMKEKDLVLKIAKYTRDYLQSNYKGVSIRMSRTGDTYPTLTERTNDANSWGADAFVSIHNNAFNGSANGYEDFIFNGNVSSKTKSLQNAMHNEIAPLFNTNRGKKTANLAVLRQTSMPAVLTENGFIDNKADADYLKKDSNLKKLGEAHAKGIAVFFGLAKGSSKPSGSGSSGGSSSSSKSISQMATEVEAGRHGSGHTNRRKSLGVSQSVYDQVRAEVNRRAGVSTSGSSITSSKSVSQMAQEVIVGKHGNSHATRRKSLGISQTQYEKVRAEVNKRLSGGSSGGGKSVGQMATEVIRGNHGSGHAARQKSLGVNNSTYQKVRAEVNKRL